MKHETIIKRECGRTIRITINLSADLDGVSCRHLVEYKEKGKRKYIKCVDSSCYSFRELSMEERYKQAHKSYLEFVSEEELELARERALLEFMKQALANTRSNY